MADTPDIVGLDPRDAPDFVSLMGDYRATRLANPTVGSKWPAWKGRGGPGGSSYTIRFLIVSVTPETRAALCLITSVPYGMTLAQMPDVTLGNVVTVCDPHGCFFNEPNEELTGRGGWASYMQPQSGYAGPSQPELNEGYGYEPSPQWEVFSLCCDPPSCEV